ncbi:MAG: Gldg family protein [bacterium]|nr:Gldg family protein [bacterium]
MRRSLLSLTGVLLLFGIVVFSNFIVQSLFSSASIDLTEEKLYSLSQGSKDIAATLPVPVTLKFYFSRTDSAAFPAIKLYGERIRDLLKEYEKAAKGNIALDIRDPRPDSEEEEWAQKYGLQPMPTGFGPGIYLGLVAVSGKGKEETVPLFNIGRQEFLEYDVTKLIYSVSQDVKPVIGIISALELKSDTDGQMAEADSWFYIKHLSQSYDVRILPVQTSKIPDDIRMLVVHHPKDFSDDTLFAIDQFLLAGGSVFAMVDPYSGVSAEMTQVNQDTPSFNNQLSSGLGKLGEAWGVKLKEGVVAADIKSSASVRIGNSPALVNYVVWLALSGNQMASDDVTTSLLDNVLLPWPGTLELTPNDGIKSEVLMKSSDEAAEVAEGRVNIGGGDPQQLLRDYKKGGRELILAVRLSGGFKTAFPEKVSAAQEASVMSSVDLPLAESSTSGNVIVVADSDFVADRFSVAKQSFLGTEVYTMRNDNIIFLENSIENLIGSNALISIRSRGKYSRPFEKVQDIEQQAELRWREQETVLQAKLNQANMRLEQLQRGNSAEGSEGRFNEELLKEVKKFREERADAQRKLRDVRSNLRKEKEQLGTTLFLVNSFLVPALLIAGYFLQKMIFRRKSV